MQKRDELLEVLLDTFGVPVRASSKCLPIALCIATDPETPAELLEPLARTDNERLLERIAEHPNVSPFLLEILASHPSPDVRAAVAENPNVPDRILADLCNDIHDDVRYRIAENASTSAERLMNLAEDPNPYVAHRARLTLMKVDAPHGLLQNIIHMVGSRFVPQRAAR
jgi:hypothetical protein